MSKSRVSVLGALLMVLAAGLSFRCAGQSSPGDPTADGDPRTDASSGSGTLTGRAIRYPLSPVEGAPESRGSEPAPGVELRISRLDGREVQSATTDAKGEFSKSLPPGSYRVELASRRPWASPRTCPPRSPSSRTA